MRTEDVQTVPMYGPSISDPSKIVNRAVPVADVQAYKAAGYQKGSIAEEAKPEPVDIVNDPAPAKPKGKK